MTPAAPAQAARNKLVSRAAVLTGYVQVALRLGLNPRELMRRCGVDPAALMNREQHVSFESIHRLLEHSAAQAACPTFGLQMAESRSAFDFGALGVLLAHKRTLREVMLTMVKYSHLLNEAVGLHVEEAGDTVVLREDILCDLPDWPRQSIELAIAILARSCSAVLGPDWRPVGIHFTHPAPPNLRDHQRVFGCRIVFSSEFNGLVCRSDDLDRPNPVADPDLVRYAEGLAETLSAAGRMSLVAEVRNAIYLLLPMEQAGVEQIARHLHHSARTLQRHLEHDGSSFSGLLEEVRQELAVRYMRNERYPIGRVASLLGYSRQSSFTQWFTKRFGMAPRQWRTREKTRLGGTGAPSPEETAQGQ